ncbi:uncharacterized protein LOC131624854 [Vicia villosa]|uniref:uncharacterized protein LOC131624854 n=1 Tax=Vicia villosa TaxID=3911 RepID=UPI00273C29CB|nr:uncharacterized protein LOC131624854 [Vicia villosa]
MPSSEMRRTTRVFGVVRGEDTSSVLRSGRRLWPNSDERGSRMTIGDDCGKKPETKKVNDDDKFFGTVYNRKKKRIVEDEGLEISGFRFRREQRMMIDPSVIVAVVKPCYDDISLFSFFLFAALRSIMKFGLTFVDLCAFVLSEPISSVYASRGIQFLQGSVTASVGICQFFGVSQYLASFCVDFSAIPLCFKSLHSALHLRYMFRSCFLVYNPVHVCKDVEDEEEIDLPAVEEEIDLSSDEEEIDLPAILMELRSLCNSYKKEASERKTINIAPEVIVISDDDDLSSHVSVKCSKLAAQNVQSENVNSNLVQTRRTSLRIREAQNRSMKNRSNNTVPSDSKGSGGQEKSCTDVASDKKLRSSTDSCTGISLSEAKSTKEDSKEAIVPSYCCTNILIVETDRCYRVERAVVISEEMSDSREWHLAVKKDGLTRCTLKAGRVMRPCSTNRYTHVKMVSLINGWKLEFANHQDWLAFKNLYKDCSQREIPIPAAKFIPVPSVCEVPDYADRYTSLFNRPEYYISTNGDEFERAITRKTGNYDMDSEDEEWLNKFNTEFQEHVSQDNFESTVDALEKTYHYNADDCYDEKSMIYWCQNPVSKKVIEAVHNYWIKKRKQKYSGLHRIFTSYQSKISPFVPKPLRQKKRSFRRRPSNSQLQRIFQSITNDQDVLDEYKEALAKVEAAKEAANKAMELAIQKRTKAQSLAQNADLAMYKATMLMRIAEAIQAGASADEAAEHFLN